MRLIQLKTKLANFWNSNWKYYSIIATPVISIFFLIPFELYYNGRQYWNWNYHLPVNFVLAGIVLYSILVGVMAIFFRKSPNVISKFAMVAFYIGFYILVADVLSPLQINKLDGSDLFSKEPLNYTLLEGIIFFAVVLFAFKGDPQYKTIFSTVTSMILVIISIIYLFLILWTPRPTIKNALDLKQNANIRGNVYHFVLDELQSDAAVFVLKENNMENNFTGFTLFKNNISNFMWTYASFPSFMTGTYFKGGSYLAWQNRFKTEGLLKDLYQKGYQISMYTPPIMWNNSFVLKYQTIQDFYDQAIDNINNIDQDFIQIWVARIMPNFMTNKALQFGQKLSTALTEIDLKNKNIPRNIPDGIQPYSSVVMLKKLINNEKYRSPNGQYVYIHPLLPHKPYVFNKNCEYDSSMRDQKTNGYYSQAICAIKLVDDFIKELKRLGRYNNATIIIQSDHGSQCGFISRIGTKAIGTIDSKNNNLNEGFLDNDFGWSETEVKARIKALLMIKPANGLGQLQYSTKLSQLVDLYPTLVQLLSLKPSAKFDGYSLLCKNISNRKGIFFLTPSGPDEPNFVYKIVINNQYQLQNSFLTVQSLGQNGSISTILSPKGSTFNIGSPKEGCLWLMGFFNKEKEGPSKSPTYFRWAGKTTYNKICFKGLQIKQTRNIICSFEVEPYIVNEKKIMMIRSKLSVAKIILKPGWAKYSVKLKFPAKEDLSIDIFYPKCASQKSLGKDPNDDRLLAVRWKSISLFYD